MKDHPNDHPTDRGAADSADDRTMSRRLVLGAAGAGAAGLAAGVLGAAGPALAASTHGAAKPADASKLPHADEPIVVHLRDPRTGELDIFAGTTQTRLRDRDLAARVIRAIR